MGATPMSDLMQPDSVNEPVRIAVRFEDGNMIDVSARYGDKHHTLELIEIAEQIGKDPLTSKYVYSLFFDTKHCLYTVDIDDAMHENEEAQLGDWLARLTQCMVYIDRCGLMTEYQPDWDEPPPDPTIDGKFAVILKADATGIERAIRHEGAVKFIYEEARELARDRRARLRKGYQIIVRHVDE
jgi:hypothetical protein